MSWTGDGHAREFTTKSGGNCPPSQSPRRRGSEFEICVVGDDAHPPWSHASSILAKRLVECLSPEVKCTLATLANSGSMSGPWPEAKRILVPSHGKRRGLDALRLAIAVRRSEADIAHLVGTNALVFSPACRILNGKTHVVRHVFTSYDNGDRIVRPARWLVNSLFIDGYAFTTPWIGDWARDSTPRTRRFLVKPPIDCDLYRRKQPVSLGIVPDSNHQFNVLYMGPLLASRFPAAIVLEGLRMVLRDGFSARLVVLTSPGRTSESKAEAVSALARQLGVEKNLVLNRVDLDEAQRVEAYNSADLVVFPFVGPVPEKLADPPFALLEAMACERVVLGTKVLSMPEVVENGKTGFLIPKATALDIRQGLTFAFTHRDLGMVGRLAREKISREFGFPKVRKDILAAYKILLDTNHS